MTEPILTPNLIPLDDLTREEMDTLILQAINDATGSSIGFLKYAHLVPSIVDALMAQQVPTLNPTRSDYNY